MKDTPETVTMEHLESLVEQVEYLRSTIAPTLTICVILLRNGFSLRGESACADPRAYDRALGEKYAYQDAIRKGWALEGYLLRQRLHEQQTDTDLKG